jgi:hypothetical protein
MDHPCRYLWTGTEFAAFVCVGTLAFVTAFAQPVLDHTAADQPEPMASQSFLTPPQHSEGRAAVRERFQHRRGRMELRHQGLELVDSVYELATDPARAAILHMQRIDGIYREQRDRDGLMVFYRDILTRTDNLAIRNVVYLKLSELAANSKDADAALALLEQGLEENLRQAD